MQSDLTGKYLNSGWNTDPCYLFISIYLFILTNYLSGSWKTVFEWYRDLNKGALLLNNSVNLRGQSQLFIIVKPSLEDPSLTLNVPICDKTDCYWILLMNVVKATFQCLMIENIVGFFTEGLEGFSLTEFWKDDHRWNGLNLLWALMETNIHVRQSDLIACHYINSYFSNPWLKEKEFFKSKCPFHSSWMRNWPSSSCSNIANCAAGGASWNPSPWAFRSCMNTEIYV